MNRLLTTMLILQIATTCGAQAQNGSDGQPIKHRLDTFTGTGLRKDFDEAMVHERQGWQAFEQHHPKIALKEFRTATEKYPSLPGAYWGIGMLLQRSNDNAGAEEAYKTSLKYNSDQWKVWKQLGNLYYSDKRYDDARKALANALSLSPPPKERRELDQMVRDVEAANKQ